MEYVLNQLNDALGHHGTARIYQYVIFLYYWKFLQKDIDAHVKQCKLYNIVSR